MIHDKNPFIQLPTLDPVKIDKALSAQYFDKTLTSLKTLSETHGELHTIQTVLNHIPQYNIDNVSFENMTYLFPIDMRESLTKDNIHESLVSRRSQLRQYAGELTDKLADTLTSETYFGNIDHKQSVLTDRIRTLFKEYSTSNVNITNKTITGYTLEKFNRYYKACQTLHKRLSYDYNSVTNYLTQDTTAKYHSIITKLGTIVTDDDIVPKLSNPVFTDTLSGLGWDHVSIQRGCTTLLAYEDTITFGIISVINNSIIYHMGEGVTSTTIKNMKNTLALIKLYDDILTQLKQQLIGILKK